jgi:peptidoglycan/LPS O-acetylase OafA/YrhL
MADLDWRALRAGAGVCLVFAVPFSALASWLTRGQRTSNTATLLSLVALGGFFLGAGVAAWVQERRMPLQHGLTAAVGSFLLAQVVFIVVRLAASDEVRWFAAMFNLTLVVGVALVGGALGSTLRRRGIVPRAR